MSLGGLNGFALVAMTLLIGIARRQLRTALAIVPKVLPVLVLACLTFAVVPLHAQGRSPIHKVAPLFPPIARQMGITGTVVVNATVDPSGKVIKAESSSNSKLFVAAAIDAVKQWKFAPGDSTDTVPITISFDKN
jgi:periplasmic protein TonB